MIASLWPAWFKAKLGGSLPENYVAFDLETSGFDMAKDVIWEIGHVIVKGRRVVEESSTVLNWQDHAIVPSHWLRQRAVNQHEQFASRGLRTRFRYEALAAGRPPEEVLAHYHEAFRKWAAEGFYFAAHYGSVFDEAMLAANLDGFLGVPDFTFGNRLIDTCALEKASQVPDNPKSHPRPGEEPRDYFKRVARARLGVLSNLSGHCFDRYNFAALGVDRESMHTALVDAKCVHYLLEALRGDAAPAVPPPAGTLFSRPAAPPPPGPPARYRGQRRS